MPRRSPRYTAGLILLGLLLVGIIVFLARQERSGRKGEATTSEAPAFPATVDFPVISPKPEPFVETFHGCPPEGDGGDPLLNRLKNRVDEGEWVPTSIAAIVALPWPASVARDDRARWDEEAMMEVTRYEGTPVVVEGYIANAKLMGPESANCHGEDREMRDWHVWIVGDPTHDRDRSVVAEVTPRVLASRPGWSLDRLRDLRDTDRRVRISGWLLLDPEHPDQIGKTRGTIWEIHPILHIEIQERGGAWVSIDQQ